MQPMVVPMLMPLILQSMLPLMASMLQLLLLLLLLGTTITLHYTMTHESTKTCKKTCVCPRPSSPPFAWPWLPLPFRHWPWRAGKNLLHKTQAQQLREKRSQCYSHGALLCPALPVQLLLHTCVFCLSLFMFSMISTQNHHTTLQ